MNSEQKEAAAHPEKDARQLVGVRVTTVPLARFVTVPLASASIGLTEFAIRKKIQKGVWAEGLHYQRRQGGIFIDLPRVERWIETGV